MRQGRPPLDSLLTVGEPKHDHEQIERLRVHEIIHTGTSLTPM